MKPAQFDLVSADSVDEVLESLSQHGEDARVMAGGQSLMPMLNMRLVRPELLVDISRVEDLDYLRSDGSSIEVGASATQASLEGWPELGEKVPLLAMALPHIGHLQTRNRGTVCGSLAHADPSSELPLVLATLGGEVVLRSRRRSRTLVADDFLIGLLTTARLDDELVAAARYPLRQPGHGHAFREIARRHGDFAIVAFAAVAWDSTVRLGVGGVADRPEVREWQGLSGNDLNDALNEFAWHLGGSDDIHATARYRRELVRRIGRKVIEEARAACLS